MTTIINANPQYFSTAGCRVLIEFPTPEEAAEFYEALAVAKEAHCNPCGLQNRLQQQSGVGKASQAD